jgi:hypothetical protein
MIDILYEACCTFYMAMVVTITIFWLPMVIGHIIWCFIWFITDKYEDIMYKRELDKIRNNK